MVQNRQKINRGTYLEEAFLFLHRVSLQCHWQCPWWRLCTSSNFGRTTRLLSPLSSGAHAPALRFLLLCLRSLCPLPPHLLPLQLIGIHEWFRDSRKTHSLCKQTYLLLHKNTTLKIKTLKLFLLKTDPVTLA